MDNKILIFILTALVSFILSKGVIYLARRYRILDYPHLDRKIHSQPTPLLGGVAIYLAWLLTAFILWQSGHLADQRVSLTALGLFFLGGLILIINGILDDKLALPPLVSIWGPILASLVVIWGGVQISYITNPEGGVLYLDSIFSYDIIPIIITFFWLLGITYTTKLLDGIDGLTSSIGLIASVVIFVVSLSWDVVGSTTSLLSLALAGAIFGFLLLNWYPAKIFLGEGGSTFIGFALGVLSIISGSKIATALLVMGLPALDILWVVVKRLRQRKPFWQGGHEHLHFRMLLAGFSQRQIVFFLSIVSLCFGVISILFTTREKISALIIVFVLMILLSSWLNYKIKIKNSPR